MSDLSRLANLRKTVPAARTLLELVLLGHAHCASIEFMTVALSLYSGHWTFVEHAQLGLKLKIKIFEKNGYQVPNF